MRDRRAVNGVGRRPSANAAATFCTALELLTVPSLHPVAFADAHVAVVTLSAALAECVERPDDGVTQIPVVVLERR
jgi:hypothetical protein